MTNPTRLERLQKANSYIAKIDRVAADVAAMLARHGEKTN